MEKYQVTPPWHTLRAPLFVVDSKVLLEMYIGQRLLLSEARGAARAILCCMGSSSSFEYNDAILDARIEALLVTSALEQQADELLKQVEKLA